MKHIGKGLFRGLVGLALAATALVASPTTASSDGPLPAIVCTAAGQVTVVESGPDLLDVVWFVSGQGVCGGNLDEPYTMQFRGVGTSNGAGLCSDTFPPVVTDLVISSVVTFRQTVSGGTKTERQVWSAPITTFPGATPYLIGGDTTGAGSMFTRIFLKCPRGNGPLAGLLPGTGNSSATFDWAQLSPEGFSRGGDAR